MKKAIIAVAATAALQVGAGGTAGLAMAADQIGVTKDQITLATIQDLSGPLAGFGKAAKNGMQMRVDEINEQGGIHGRKIKFLAEDSGYNPQKGLLAAQNWCSRTRSSPPSAVSARPSLSPLSRPCSTRA